MKEYPDLGDGILKNVDYVLRLIVRERKTDVNDFNNLNNVFMSGRKVGKVPTGAADITDGDRVGDFNYDPSYLYIVVNNSGTAQWG